MPKLESVLVGVTGFGSEAPVPQQSHEKLVTQYHIAGPDNISDSQFYNDLISEDFDIYGFSNIKYSYTRDSSVSEIVDFFNSDEDIKIVFCDMNIQRADFSHCHYLHSEEVPNYPFFIRSDVIKEIGFEGGEEGVWQRQLQKMINRGLPLYHLAKPLMTVSL
jgi:hypothetical protein